MFSWKSQSLTMLVTKICTNTNLPAPSDDVFIFHYVYEWVKRTWNQRPSFYFVSIFFGLGLAIPADRRKMGGGALRSWNFSVFREQYTPRLWDFFLFESFMFCHFHVSRSRSLSRKCFAEFIEAVSFWTSRREPRVSVTVQWICWMIGKNCLGEQRLFGGN